MKPYALAAFFLGFCLITAANPITCVFSQATAQVQSTILSLYRDGLVHCEQAITLNELLPQVILSLISESPENILLLDENSTVVDYTVAGKNLTAYTLGANKLSVEYDTM